MSTIAVIYLFAILIMASGCAAIQTIADQDMRPFPTPFTPQSGDPHA